jgi:DNA-binding CsgD family transcriptional regulator
MRRVLAYGLLGGVLIAALKVLEYKHFVRAYPTELYGGLVAILFAAIGIHLGRLWKRGKDIIVVVKEVQVPAPQLAPEPAPTASGPFSPDLAQLQQLGITRREHEILVLIAEGLSNREIGARLFISENTVKTHSSRLFEKLGVGRRVQAAQRGRELRLLP